MAFKAPFQLKQFYEFVIYLHGNQQKADESMLKIPYINIFSKNLHFLIVSLIRKQSSENNRSEKYTFVLHDLIILSV